MLLLAAMLGGCSGKNGDRQPEPSDVENPDGPGGSDINRNEGDGETGKNVRNPATVNWDSSKSIIETAVENKTMIIQFMSGEGLYISGNNGNTDKWGDAVLLVFPNGETMLIDAGMADYGPFLVKNLKALGIERLDYCMMSHQHNDHYAGFLAAGGVFDSFEVGTFLYSGIYAANYSDVMKVQMERAAELKNMKLVTLAQGR